MPTSRSSFESKSGRRRQASPSIRHSAADTFFDKLFNNGFKENGTQKLELPHIDPAAFNYLVEYLYNGGIAKGVDGELVKNLLIERAKTNTELGEPMGRVDNPMKVFEKANEKFQQYYEDACGTIAERALLYIKVWVMGDYFMISHLQNLGMLRLLDEFDPRKMAYHTGFDYLILVRPCYESPNFDAGYGGDP